MASLNKVLLIGNLTRPPELRYTPSGTAVADLRLAVNRNYSTQTGEKREEVCFLTVVVWGKQAESCGEYLDKGSQVFVEGRLQTRDWEGKDGQKRTSTEVVAERVQFMSRTKGGGARIWWRRRPGRRGRRSVLGGVLHQRRSEPFPQLRSQSSGGGSGAARFVSSVPTRSISSITRTCVACAASSPSEARSFRAGSPAVARGISAS